MSVSAYKCPRLCYHVKHDLRVITSLNRNSRCPFLRMYERKCQFEVALAPDEATLFATPERKRYVDVFEAHYRCRHRRHSNVPSFPVIGSL